MSALLVRHPGLFSTIQDMGRFGAQALGMPVAGAVDSLALRLANALVGNPERMGALEIGFMGPTLEVLAESVRIAVAGPIQITVGEGEGAAVLDFNRSHLLRQGQVAKIGYVSGKAYAYLAVEGGFDVPTFMGSQSTYTRAAIGGFRGRKLEARDVVPLNLPRASARPELALAGALPYGEGAIRVVPGPQRDHFTPQALETLQNAEYVVTRDADRMGLRLDGPVLTHSDGADIVSDGIATGCIQVPGSGQPIILLADHQTIGGYPKIATVVSADLPRLGQMTPGQRLRFACIDVADAEAIRRRQEGAMRRTLSALEPARPPGGIDVEALRRENLVDGVVDALSRS